MSRISRLFLVVVAVYLIVAALPVQAAGLDLGGRTITYVSNMGLFSDPRFEERRVMAEQEFNCKIVFKQVGWGDIQTSFMTRLLAGDSVGDICTMGSRHFWPLLAQGYIYPVGNAAPAGYWDSLLPLERAVVDNMFSYKGVRYALGSWRDNVEDLQFIIYNKSLLEREGIEDPYDLYAAGEWDWDAMTEIAAQVTRDTNGDGVTDQWGMTDGLNPVQLALANDAKVTREVGGKVVFAFDSENAYAAFTQWGQWRYTQKVMDDTKGGQQMFIDGKAAFHVARPYEIGGINTKMQDDYGILPFPKGPNADGYRYPMWEAVTMFALPSNVQKPEELIAVHQFIFEDLPGRDDAVVATLQGYARDRNSFEVLTSAREAWTGEAYAMGGITGLQWGSSTLYKAVAAAAKGEKSPSAAMAEIKPVLQAALDDAFNQ